MLPLFSSRSSANHGSALSLRRTYLPPGVSYQFDSLIPRTRGATATMALAILDVLISPIITSATSVNLQSAADSPIMFEITGDKISQDISEPFSYSVSCTFEDYPSRDEIRFSTKIAQPDWDMRAALSATSDDFILRISQIFVGLSIYRATPLTKLSQFGPVCSETIKMRVSEDEVKLSIVGEWLPSLAEAPLAHKDLGSKISTILSEYCNYNVVTVFKQLEKEIV